MTELVHATAVARDGAAVLLLGPPGAGKSDLALRLIDRGWLLVGDDQVLLKGADASAPTAIAGLIEVRGIGIVRVPYSGPVPARLAVQLEPPTARLPEPDHWTHGELTLPLVRIDPRAPSAPLLVELALTHARSALSMAGQ
ncbi:MAG: HPr kinase/phosphatase C-terminal domain-containing protein [Sphingomonadaceae bacterium]|nr:HPr kinase/phosphatase C-terminal domain-containing protein [Sphingomonadaceae bacterium]